MGKKREKIQTAKNNSLFQNNPFDQLGVAFPENVSKEKTELPDVTPGKEMKNNDVKRYSGRLDVKREKSGRGGKTVTVIRGMQVLGEDDRKEILKQLQGHCGVGGTVKEDCVEMQGDQRERIKPILEKMGFKIVFSGG
ncbi:MAG: hypothetical protein AUJ82_07760 [Verrucomicrobia bacterium CG1_02_43_26]|nr:MAG: hypothetical protein AUJ82_07760 [Verrucomicrobia bacterium CG1_02_43_26]